FVGAGAAGALLDAAFDPGEGHPFQGPQLGPVSEHDAAQLAAVDLALVVEDPVSPAADHLFLDGRLPQGFVAELVAGDDYCPAAGEFGGHPALAAADAADQTNDWLAHRVTRFRCESSPATVRVTGTSPSNAS